MYSLRSELHLTLGSLAAGVTVVVEDVRFVVMIQ